MRCFTLVKNISYFGCDILCLYAILLLQPGLLYDIRCVIRCLSDKTTKKRGFSTHRKRLSTIGAKITSNCWDEINDIHREVYGACAD